MQTCLPTAHDTVQQKTYQVRTVRMATRKRAVCRAPHWLVRLYLQQGLGPHAERYKTCRADEYLLTVFTKEELLMRTGTLICGASVLYRYRPKPGSRWYKARPPVMLPVVITPVPLPARENTYHTQVTADSCESMVAVVSGACENEQVQHDFCGVLCTMSFLPLNNMGCGG